jgi:hypothetical protein
LLNGAQVVDREGVKIMLLGDHRRRVGLHANSWYDEGRMVGRQKVR